MARCSGAGSWAILREKLSKMYAGSIGRDSRNRYGLLYSVSRKLAIKTVNKTQSRKDNADMLVAGVLVS